MTLFSLIFLILKIVFSTKIKCYIATIEVGTWFCSVLMFLNYELLPICRKAESNKK